MNMQYVKNKEINIMNIKDISTPEIYKNSVIKSSQQIFSLKYFLIVYVFTWQYCNFDEIEGEY